MSRTKSADGTTIHYDDHGGGTGDGSGVLLVHGITESSATWDPVVEFLVPDVRVVTLDLRGHGRSRTADAYDLLSMAGDVAAVATAAGIGRPHLVGHSLGGTVVTAAASAMPVASVVNVDQSLRLDGFKDQLMAFEAHLRDPDLFCGVIDGLFESLAGPLNGTREMQRVNESRRARQEVVLGVWDVVLTSSQEELAALVDAALAGFAGRDVPYLSVFGADPGEGYAEWIAERIPGAVTEVWDDHGHYPHLVEPGRFAARLRDFWA